ncbi:hypothetical protein ABK040_015779 [Willaertia magna]
MPSIIETNPSVPPPAESTSSPIVQSSPSIPITSNSTPPIFSSPVVLSSPLSCPLNFNGDCSLLVASNSAPVDSPIVMRSTIPIVPSPSILPPTSISSPLVQPSFVPLTSVSSSYVVSPSAPSVKPSTSKNSSPVEIPGNYSLPNVPHCSTNCSWNGECIGNEICDCKNGFGGIDCSIFVCNGKLSSDPLACGDNGLCTGPNTCTCKSEDYTGPWCDEFVCGLYQRNDPRGMIVKRLLHPLLAMVNIMPTQPYATAEAFVPHWTLANSGINACSGSGSCERDTATTTICNCNPGYYGNECEVPSCNGLLASDPKVCSGGGRYIGSKCEIPLCFGIPANDTNSCSQKGLCLDNNKCECSAGFTGDKCQFIDATDPSRECKGEFVLSNQFSLIGNKLYFVMVMLDISCGKTVSSNKVEIYSDVNIPPSTVAKYKDNNELLRDLITTTTDKKTGTVYITLNNDMLSNPPKDYIIIKKIDTIGNDVYVSELILTAPDNKPLPVTKIDKLIRDESTGSTYAVTTEKDVDGNSKVIVTYIDELNNKIIPVGVIEQETTKDQLSTSTVEGSKLIIPGKINTNTETLSVITLNKDKPVTVITNTLPPSISTNGKELPKEIRQGTEYVIVASDSGLDVYKVNPSLETGKGRYLY